MMRLARSAPSEAEEENDDDMGFALFDDGPGDMNYLGSYVNSKGNVSATYRIPGVVTIPSDGTERTFTIVELQLDASMSWVSVPKVDARTHLKVRSLDNVEPINDLLFAGQNKEFVRIYAPSWWS